MKAFKTAKIEYKIALVISVILFGMVALTSYYMDLKSLTIWTTNLWDTLFYTGQFREYYQFSGQNLYGLDHAMVGSDILIYLPWAIWNLPIWALQYFGNMEIIHEPWLLFYSKCFLIVVLAACLIMAAKIARCYTEDEKQIGRMLFLSATSFFVLTGVAYIGQNDVLVILAFLVAFYYFLKEKKLAFVLWAAVSIAFKPFFFFSYIALILLFEKKIHKIILYGCAGFSIYLAQKLPFLGAPAYKESLTYGPTKGAFGLMLESSLNIPPAGISLFVLGLLVIYCFAYFQVEEDVRSTNYLYYVVAPLIALFLFTRYESYRPLYLMPFLYLLLMTKPQFYRINLLLETIATGSLLYYYMIQDSLFYNGHYLHIPNSNPEFQTITEFFAAKLPGQGFTAFTAIFIVAMGFILIINHPKFDSTNKILLMKEERWLVIARSLLYGLPFGIAVCLKCL